MTWNSLYPVSTLSVKANIPIGQQNTTYTETIMGKTPIGANTNSTKDHFWAVGSNEDGRHRFINSPAFTVGGVPADPVIGSGMDAVEYVKTTNGRAERFHRNAQGIYQYVPSFLTGTVVISGTYINIISVPANVYGEIFIFQTVDGRSRGQAGFFKSNGSVCDAWAYGINSLTSSSSTPDASFNILFGNGTDASGLNIRARTSQAGNGLTWNYRITYRAV